MTDIYAYAQPEKYLDFQNRRPDYVPAIQKSIELAEKYLVGRDNLVVADFCCGTGSNALELSRKIELNKAILVDINRGLLDIAEKSEIKTRELEVICEDVLNVKFAREADIVLSIFAYHHIPDEEKALYLDQVKNVLREGGMLLFAEIYLSDKERTLKYYEHLFESIPAERVVPGLKDFIYQTAESSDFEFKVSRDFAEKQLYDAGFKKHEEVKVWPLDDVLSAKEGMFVSVWSL